MSPKKRRDVCLLCASRRCRSRIVCEVPGYAYDEIACADHGRDLELHADKTIPRGMLRTHTASSSPLSRGK